MQILGKRLVSGLRGGVLYGAALLGAGATGLGSAQELRKAELVLNEGYQLYLDTTVSNCKAQGRLRWFPQEPGNPKLLVGDSYEVDVKVRRSQAQVANWRGQWYWPSERKCGKNTCKKQNYVDQDVPASFALGTTLTLSIYDDDNKTSITRTDQVTGVRISPGKLALVATFADFQKPSGKKPDGRARLVKDFCASVVASSVHVADVTIKVVRRPRN